MKKFIQIHVFALLLFCSDQLHSQKHGSHLKFQRFGAEQGLTVTTAFSIVQDDYGFLWASTIDGLLRYDGYKFIHFKNDYNDSTSISDNTVSTLSKGKGNIIWVGTYSGGLNRLDVNTGKFKRILHNSNDENSLSSNRVWATFENKNNILWIGTDNGLNRLDLSSDKITRFFHVEGDSASLCNNSVLSLLEDKNGNLWVGTINGLSKIKLDAKKNIVSYKSYRYSSCSENCLSGNIVLSLLESKDGSIWIGTSNGVSHYDPQHDNFRNYRFSTQTDTTQNQVYSYLNSYGDNAARAIYEDKNGHFWITTDRGLKILHPSTGDFKTYHSDPANPFTLSADLLSGICEDRS
jgi:ligand-binding sensor domain-containing protein